MLLEDELPDDLDGAEERGALLLDDDDREGDEALGTLRDDEDPDDERPDEPYDLDGTLLLLPTEEGVEARGDGALRLPLDVRGTTGVRLELELLDEPVLGMITGDRVDGADRD